MRCKRMSSLERIIKKNRELFRSIAIRFLKERRRGIQKELSEINRRIGAFEKKYGTFDNFSRSMQDGFDAHEIWFEWKSLIELRKELQKELKEIEEAARELIREK